MKGYNKDAFETNASSINFKTLKDNKHKARKSEQYLKQMWEQLSWQVPKVAKPDYISKLGEVNFKVKQAFVGYEQQQFLEAIVMVVDNEGKGQMVRVLPDTGYSKSLILIQLSKWKW